MTAALPAVDTLVEQVVDETGRDDFAGDEWREGLDHLVGSLRDEAGLSEIGVEVVRTELTAYLTNRLGVVAWAAEHPPPEGAGVEQPVVIIGQPRTGTTILHDLLAQDQRLRAPLTWEVDHPLPPPLPGDRDDPRIAEVDAALAMTDVLVPGFRDYHPMGPLLAQEDARITGADFKSMIFPTQYRVPEYHRWLLHEADMASPYRWHRRFLEHLGSADGSPTLDGARWLLKTPAHLWHLGELLEEYPDAVLIQTHRDPLRVITSLSALVAHLRTLAAGDADIVEAADEWADVIFLGLERGMTARDEGTVPDDRVHDVQFTAFMTDPWPVLHDVYAGLGMDLTPEVEERMRGFLAGNPGDGGGGGSRYRWADTGLDEASLRDRAAPYMERFGVTEEPLAT